MQATDRVSSTQRQMGCVRLLGLEEGAHSSCSGGGEPVRHCAVLQLYSISIACVSDFLRLLV